MASEAYADAGPADLAQGGLDCRDVAGVPVLIARGASGDYFAVAPLCSHAALSLAEGRVRGEALLCPHHGARFDLKSGRALGPPAHTGIAAYPTRVVEGRVQVWVY